MLHLCVFRNCCYTRLCLISPAGSTGRCTNDFRMHTAAGLNSSCCECALLPGSMSCSSTHLFSYLKDLVRCSQLSWFSSRAPQAPPAVGPLLHFPPKPLLSCNLSLTSPAFHQQKTGTSNYPFLSFQHTRTLSCERFLTTATTGRHTSSALS